MNCTLLAKMTSETDQGSVDLDDMTNDDDDLLGDTVELSAFEIDRVRKMH